MTSKQKPKDRKKVVKCQNCSFLEKLADCYASVIEAVYDGEEIEDADKRIRKLYHL